MTYSTLIWKLHDHGIGDAPHTMKHLTVHECFSDAEEGAEWNDEADEMSIKSVEDEIESINEFERESY
jgi:hypothetical protein